MLVAMSVTVQAKLPASSVIEKFNLNDGFSPLVKAVKPAVVNISTTSSTKISPKTPHFGNRKNPQMDQFSKKFFDEFFGNQFRGLEGTPRKTHALGSGFIVSENGIVVTNHHVINGADEIEVVFQDGKRFPATLKGSDKKTDIAVLQIDTDYPLPYVKFGDSNKVEVGDWVVAIGNPFGLGGSVSAGVVSARGRDIRSGPYDDFIQIDAPINKGNSGGPLFNTKGEVIGVNSAIYSPSGGSVGIGFSIPSELVQNIVKQLQTTGQVARGWLGVHIQAVTKEIAQSLGLDDTYGALVAEVVEDSPALRAGLQSGDVILTYNDERVDKMRDLPRLVANTPANDKVNLGIWRNETKRMVSVVISKTDESIALASASEEKASTLENALGLALSEITEELRRKYSVKDKTQGVIITDIDPNSEAAERGVRVGDVIKKVGSKSVTTVAGLDKALKLALDGKKPSLFLLIEREGQVFFVTIPVE